jgi:hypothetical protein
MVRTVQCEFYTMAGPCTNKCLVSKAVHHCWMHSGRTPLTPCRGINCINGTRSLTGYCGKCDIGTQSRINMLNKRLNNYQTCPICQVTVQDLPIHNRGAKHIRLAAKAIADASAINSEFMELCNAYDAF